MLKKIIIGIVGLVILGAIIGAVTGGQTPSPAPSMSTVTTPSPTEAVPSLSALTITQSNAVDSVNNYLAFIPFSRQGLIDQLVFDKYSVADATFAVDLVSPDWNDQAAKKAQNYLDLMSFSRQGLIDQLTFDGFTSAQARFGVAAVGY